MNFNRNLLSEAVRFGLVAGAVGVLGATPAFAQDDDATELDRIEVTGSRIKRVDIEGPNPITVIDRQDLEVTGDISVADVLRSSTFNTFGSFQQSSGSTAQSQATINLRGVGSQRTLILLDGRRLAASPTLGSAAQNLNSIPFAAVERIEVLRGGASAIYGSDAIGGVVNVVLRKDFEGLNFTAQIERPTRGEPDANSGSVTGGITSDRGNLTFAIDHQERDIMFNRDRNTGIPGLNPAQGISVFGYPGTAYLYDPGFTGFNGTAADPQCPSALGSSELFPNSGTFTSDFGTFCGYNYAATSANEASLRRDSLLVNGTFELTDNVSAFARVIALTSESFGRYAAAPFTSPFPTMSADNPNNPWPGNDLLIAFRFVPGGFRDNTTSDHMMDVLLGLEGTLDWFGGADWEIGLRHVRNEVDDLGNGYALGPPLQALIDSGQFNPFASPNDPGFLASVGDIRHTITQSGELRYAGIDGQMSFDLFEMANGPVGFAVGFDYRDEAFESIVDAQSEAGNVQGTAGGSAGGERAAYAVFAEALFPILPNLNLSIAGRYDHYNDFGNSTNPQISLEFRPIDSLLLRGSWGTGFRAPDLGILYQQTQQSFTPAIDVSACEAGLELPFNPCTQNQYETYFSGNPNLDAEESDNWSLGMVWNPLDELTIGIDYYDIELENQIGSLPVQTILNLEAEGDPLVDGLVIRNPNGSVDQILAPALNLSGFKTSGVDVEIDYRIDTAFGTFNPYLQYTYVRDFVQEIIPGSGFDDTFAIAQPDQRAGLGVNWSYGDFTATVLGNMVGDSDQIVEEEVDGEVVERTERIGTWVTWDAQVGWATPWDGKVSFGVRNIADRAPPLSSDAFAHPFYANSQYDFYGRVPYVRYEQNF